MAQNARYESAKEIFAKIGVDTEAALAKLQDVRISMHCWQADDVHGFEGMGALTGGIHLSHSNIIRKAHSGNLKQALATKFALCFISIIITHLIWIFQIFYPNLQ